MRCRETRSSLVTETPIRAARALGPARPNLVLGICCLSLLLIGMDVTIVNVAIPEIQRSFGANLQDIQWVIDGYTLVLASLLLLTGSVSDRYGRKLIFQVGLVIFTSASLLCSFASDVRVLIAFRLLQGVGASMLNPVALSIVVHTFPDPKARARAIGIWAAVFGTALGLGPIVGGILTQMLGWRAIFVINVPVGIAAVLLTAWFVPESKAPRARAFDPVGQTLIIVLLGCVTYAVIDSQQLGWTSLPVISLFGCAAAAMVGLVFYELQLIEPLLDVRFFRSVPFSGATIIAVIAFGSFASILFLNSLLLQQERGFTPLQSGLCTLPLAVMATLCGPISGRMVGRHGTRPSLLVAGFAMISSALLLAQLTRDTPVQLMLLAYGLFGIGLGVVNPAISTVAVSGMPSSQSGVAAAVASTSRQIGACLGVAIAGTVVHIGQRNGFELARSTHPLWWAMCGLAMVVVVLAWLTNTSWAQEGSRRALGIR